jgi:phage terminase large subunit
MSRKLCQNNTSVPEIEIIDKFKPLFFLKKRYKVYHGGRGGGKTINFGLALLTMAMQKKMRVLCVREIQKSIRDSVHKNLRDMIEERASFDEKNPNIWNGWKITERSIRYANGSEFIFSGLKNNAFQIKSMANIDICWVEEAHAISYSSLKVLKPTIRNKGSEIWFSFNRETENDPVWEEFCVDIDKDTFVCEVNYYDNPKFPDVLDKDRLRDYRKVETGRMELEEYEHVWLGKPKSFMGSSYYGKQIRLAEKNERICRGIFDETLKVHTVWDLGIGDSMSIWFFQYYGKQIRVLDYYENSGEGFPFYADVLFKEKNYRYGQHFAPVDINVRELGTGEPRIVAAQRLGIDFYQLPKDNNVIESINHVRRNFHRCWFDSEKTTEGLKCLKNYRKEFDEKRQIYKDKPLHDWASHGADSFKYLMMAIDKISPSSGFHKTNDEFDDDYEEQCRVFDDNRNKITGY